MSEKITAKNLLEKLEPHLDPFKIEGLGYQTHCQVVIAYALVEISDSLKSILKKLPQ